MKLLIDVGNTRLKAALWDGQRLQALGAAAHAGAAGKVDFAALWKGAPPPSAIFIASVASLELGEQLWLHLHQRFGVAPIVVNTPAAACGVRNAYTQPDRLGIDRFLGLVALHAAARRPWVLASSGTALTLDAISADGAHLGGLIGASPPLMLDALLGGTARLARPHQAHVVELADNTADAIESGVWLSAIALIERFVARASARLRTAPELMLTGGGADRLAALLEVPHRVDVDLVLRGLAVYADSVN